MGVYPLETAIVLIPERLHRNEGGGPRATVTHYRLDSIHLQSQRKPDGNDGGMQWVKNSAVSLDRNTSKQMDVIYDDNWHDVVKLCDVQLGELKKDESNEHGRNVGAGYIPERHPTSICLLGYTENEDYEDGLDPFPTTQLNCFEPNQVTFMSFIKMCSNREALNHGKKVHNFIIQCGFEHDTIIVNALIHMYIKCGMLQFAQSLFEKSYERSLVTWSTLIAGYVQHGYDLEALGIFEKMQNEGFKPDKIIFTPILKCCHNLQALEKSRKIYSYILEMGWETDVYLCSTLLEIYLDCEGLDDACIIFNRAQYRDAVMWNILISGHASRGCHKDVLSLFEQMQLEFPIKDQLSFVCIIKACSGNMTLAEAIDIHICIIACGFDLDTSVGCSLIDMYVKCGSLESAELIFNKLPCWDVVIWTALLSGYAQLGVGKKVLDLLDRMCHENIQPNHVTYLGILKACSMSAALEQGRQIHAQIINDGLQMEGSVGNSLVDMYAKCGSLLEAHFVFNTLPYQDAVCWSALIAGYAEFGKRKEALSIFEEMKQTGVNPNQGTYVCILKACCDVDVFPDLQLIHSDILSDGLESDNYIGNALIDMYMKCGHLQDASIIFHRLAKKDSITWGLLIGGHARNELGKEALNLFCQMQQGGFDPDSSTFIFVLKACSCTMSLEYGRDIHVCLLERGLESDCYVGCAIIDMYAKCGSLFDAEMVFERTTHDHVTWSSMIAGYAQDNNYSLAMKYFNGMLQERLHPDAISFLSILSASARAGLLEEALSHLKSMVEEHGIMPAMEHFNVLTDLLGHIGCLDEAEDLLETMCFGPNIIGWTSLLSACRNHLNLTIGRRCYRYLLHLDSENSSAYLLMSNVYACAGMLDAAEEVENLRKARNLRKKLPKAFIEINKQVHHFTVGDWSHDLHDEIRATVKRLEIQSRENGYNPNLDVVLNPTSEEGKEDVLCGHCEKLALAFGIINSYQGTSIRIAKNLRVCQNCHKMVRVASKLEMREIIITDSYCVHRFRDGECSCKYYE